jgi:hypothetical protein
LSPRARASGGRAGKESFEIPRGIESFEVPLGIESFEILLMAVLRKITPEPGLQDEDAMSFARQFAG